MKAFRSRQFAASRQPNGDNPVAGRWQRDGDDVIDRCRPYAPLPSSPMIRHSDELRCGTGGHCQALRSSVHMAKELPGFIPRVLQLGDVSLLRADEAVLKESITGIAFASTN